MIPESHTKTNSRSLAAWFQTSQGRLLLEKERAIFSKMSSNLFGYQLLQMGFLDPKQPLMSAANVRRQWVISTPPTSQGMHGIVADSGSLPIKTDSIDAVLLPHSLDFCDDPQQVLREIERVLIPEGRVIISGFNPFSLWGMNRLLRYKSQNVPWNGHFISYIRLHDWLSLLGFDVEQTEVMMFRPPLKNHSMLQRLEFMEKTGQKFWPRFAGVYTVRAVKRVSTLTPIKPAWKRRPRLLPGQAIEPTTRESKHGSTG